MSTGKVAKVQLWGKTLGFATVELGATYGAVVGRDLRWDDGTVVTREQLMRTGGALPATPTSTGEVVVVWTAILEVPANVQALASLSTTGIMVRAGVGDIQTRTLQQGDGIVITYGDGVADDPIIAIDPAVLATINSAGLIYLSDIAPADPVVGMVWGDTTDGTLYVWYDDGDSQQWVEFGSIGGGSGSASMPAVMARISLGF